MPRVPSYEVEAYSYYHITKEGDEAFGRWLDKQTWEGISDEVHPDELVDKLHDLLNQGMNESYETEQRKKKNSEPSWMTDWIRDLIEDRRAVFKNDEGRSERWKKIKKKTARIVKKRKAKHNRQILDKFDNETNPGRFFQHLNSLLGANETRWSP